MPENLAQTVILLLVLFQVFLHDDIVRICREEFGRGNDFAVKITYRTTGTKPEDLLNLFRNSFNPRIAVTVDMALWDIKEIGRAHV